MTISTSLFQAIWTGNQMTAGHYYLGAARVYAPGYYQNNTVVHSTTQSTFPPAIGCETQPSANGCSQASLQQTWTTSWSGYWANALAVDSNPIHVMQGSVVVANSGSTLVNTILQAGGVSSLINGAIVAGSLVPVQGTPRNISVDYQGDVFVVGQTEGSLIDWTGPSSGTYYDTYLAKFQNVNPANTACTNTSCFKVTYQDVNTGTLYSPFTATSPNPNVPPAPSESNLTSNVYDASSYCLRASATNALRLPTPSSAYLELRQRNPRPAPREATFRP